MTKIVHITPHLGGGVGRVLSRVAEYNALHKTDVKNAFICLEAPEKTQFVDALNKHGIEVALVPSEAIMQKHIADADIVQIEWWHHPLIAKWLIDASGIICRLAIWSHTSGLHYPAFPKAFPQLPHVFMATTAVSKADVVVPSSGGFDDIPPRTLFEQGPPRYGYIGSLNEAKLHPRIMEFLEAATIHVQFYGDADVATPLKKSPLVDCKGYTQNPVDALQHMDVFVYLLNPQHYGTTENALLEAMAAGVVPIVMDNAVEASIVKHGKTGLIVNSPEQFVAAVRQLENPEFRQRMAIAAAADIRHRFSLENTVSGLKTQYDKIINQPKRSFDFRAVFGATPFDWFLAGLGNYASLFMPGAEENKRKERQSLPFLYEKSKSSLAHFLRYFPEDKNLCYWEKILSEDITSRRKRPAH